MRVVLANLRVFYQCRALWWSYLLIAFFSIVLGGQGLWRRFSMSGIWQERGVYFTLMGLVCALSFAAGIIVASVQMEVMSKPFSFCLPSHRAAFRKLTLLAGLIVSVLLVLLLRPAIDAWTDLSPLYFVGVSLTAYFIGATIGLTFSGAVNSTALFTVVLLPMGSSLLDWKTSNVPAGVLTSATATIALGAVSTAAAWFWLGRIDLFRRRCGKPWLGISEFSDAAAKEKYRWARASDRAGHVPPGAAEGLLLNLATRSKHGGMATYVWGSLYTWFLPGGGGRSATAWMGLYGLICAVLAWYMPFMGPFFIASAAVLVSRSATASIPDSSLLVAGGRRERSLATVVRIMILGTLVTLSITGTFAAMDLMRGHTLLGWIHIEAPQSSRYAEMAPMNLRLVILLLSLFPVARLLEIRLGGKGHQIYMGHRGVLISVIMLAMLGRTRLMAIPPAYVTFAFILCWIVCVLGVHRTIMRSDLVRR